MNDVRECRGTREGEGAGTVVNERPRAFRLLLALAQQRVLAMVVPFLGEKLAEVRSRTHQRFLLPREAVS